MDQQTVINILISGVGAGIIWWVNAIWQMMGTLQQDISNLHVELAKNYATRAEMQATLDRILDAIDELRKATGGK